jgi:DNA phosphorothioation-dependent restriction protein DptH
MNFFAQTVQSHLAQQIEHLRAGEGSLEGRKVIFMIPAMREATTLAVTEAIHEFCLQDASLSLELKIADDLIAEWSSQGQSTVDQRKWRCEQVSLTYYRSRVYMDSAYLHVVVLCGADRVVDSAGLDDFHTCDPDMIWHSVMQKSFRSWIRMKLTSVGISDVTDGEFETIDRVIKPVLTCGCGDLLSISDWLADIDVVNESTATDVAHTMLRSFASFGLPVFGRFPLSRKGKSLTRYINRSVEFFSYNLFLEARHRDGAVKAIDALLTGISDGELYDIPLDDEDVCGPYGSGDLLLRGLRRYIMTDAADERSKLMQCDFVVIADQILKFRMTTEKKERDPLRKLSGGPIEVLLTAVWAGLYDLFANHREDELAIGSILVKATRFKHDVDEGSEDDEGQWSTKDSADRAREYLVRLIGGVDAMVVNHVELKNADGSDIGMGCDLLSEDMSFSYSKTAEPALDFTVQMTTDETTFSRKFAWRLPEHHANRLAADLVQRASAAMQELPYVHKLPVHHVTYYEELLHATADDEICRVLLHSIRDERGGLQRLTNLLNAAWTEKDDPLSAPLKVLAERYDSFVQDAAINGIFGALFNEQHSWPALRAAYAETFEAFAALDDVNQTSLAGMLVRAFLIVAARQHSLDDTWYADTYEATGIATVLHPAVIEMLEAQSVYLTRCFNYAASNQLSLQPGKRPFPGHIWQSYVNLSSIQSPLSGLLATEDNKLDANVRGVGLIHRIGNIDTRDTPLSTQLLLRYHDGTDDDGSLSDIEMFRETSESKLLVRLMQDYFDLHPHARDGLNLAVYRNSDIQPVIAAVHKFLRILATPNTKAKPNSRYVLSAKRRRPYAISVTLFTQSSDGIAVSSWVDQWRDCWEAAETESKYELYRLCRFSVAHRIIEKDEADGSQLVSFQKLIGQQFEADITVFYDFIGAGSGVNKFAKVAPFDITSRNLKFPILEKACCTIDTPRDKYRRQRVISNRQFTLGAYHANLMHCLQTESRQMGSVVVGAGDFTPWRALMDTLHTKSEWVVCIDPSIDDRLIKEPADMSAKKREIVGFGSGVGTHGEDNFTISTQQSSLADVHDRLRHAIHRLYGGTDAGWSVNDSEMVAKGILHVAPELSGLSLVRATGVRDEYIRDFLAYLLSRKMLQTSGEELCESLISLDAYRHWFDLSDDLRRPDLMWMRCSVTNSGRLRIAIRLVECKMGKRSKAHVSKAKGQIDNGLRVLNSAFAPSSTEADRPDRRYWWMQLHRLIACKAEVSMADYPGILSALERLAEGDYEICWDASIFAFWLDDNISIEHIGSWDPGTSCNVTGHAYAIGGGFVRNMFADRTFSGVEWASIHESTNQIVDNDDGEDSAHDDYTTWDDNGSGNDSGEGSDEPLASDIPAEDADKAADDSQSSDTTEPSADYIPIGTSKSADEIGAPFPRNTDNSGVTVESSGPVSQPKSPPNEQRILLGATNAEHPVYWEFNHPDLANRHMLIFGASGQGKTYAIQCILCEMGRLGQHSLIIDYTDGFRPDHLEPYTGVVLSPAQHVVSNDPLPINPFIPQSSDSGGLQLQEKPGDVATRIASLFNAVYHIGDQQRSALYEAVSKGVQEHGSRMDLALMLDLIDELSEDTRYKSSAQKLHSKIKPFVDKEPFESGEGGFNWDSLFGPDGDVCNIFQLAGMDVESGRLITEFVLWDLYGHLQAKGNKTDPKVLVLDEVQNLDHTEGSPLSKYLREGRKFGVSLVLATQIMSGMSKDERDRMFNAEHKLFFKPTDTELKAFAQLAAEITRGKVDDWAHKLSALQKGECYSIGQMLDAATGKLQKRALKISIVALEERGFNA